MSELWNRAIERLSSPRVTYTTGGGAIFVGKMTQEAKGAAVEEAGTTMTQIIDPEFLSLYLQAGGALLVTIQIIVNTPSLWRSCCFWRKWWAEKLGRPKDERR